MPRGKGRKNKPKPSKRNKAEVPVVKGKKKGKRS